MQAPALHIDPKSRFGPCDEARTIATVVSAARGIEVPMPILFGRRNLGYVVGQRNRPFVWKSEPLSPLEAAGFPGLAAITQATGSGQVWKQFFVKGASGTSLQWIDCWPCSGNPVAGSFAGSAFTAFNSFTDATIGALAHGGNVTPSFKVTTYMSGNLTGATTQSVLILYDRVLTYEACTFNAAVLQNMTNTNTAQRYISAGQPGLQVSVFAQTATGTTAANLTQLSYTNQAGTSGISLPLSAGTPAFAASMVAAGTSGAYVVCPVDIGNSNGSQLFLTLAPGDTGVQQIASYTTSAANTGTFYFLLNRPLAYLMMPAPGIQFETDYVFQRLSLERIYDGACLSFFAFSGANSNMSQIAGRTEMVWG